MAETLTHKIIRAHLAEGAMAAGEEIALRIDQTLIQDATGTKLRRLRGFVLAHRFEAKVRY